MKKRILSLLVVVCMLISCTSFTAFAETAVGGTFTDSNGLEFSWSLDTATGAFAVSGAGAMTLDENPHATGQLPWVDYEGTDYRSEIKSVTIGSGITRLGRQLFQACTALTEVTVPGDVTHTGWGVFNGCTSLAKVTFEEGFLDMGDKAFIGCTALSELNLPSTVKMLRQNIVQGCTSLKTLTLPQNLTNIHQNTFGDNKGGENGAAVVPAPQINIGHSIQFTVYKYSLAEEYLDTYYPDTIVNRIEEPTASGDIGADTNGEESGLKWAIYGTKLFISRKTDEAGSYVGTGIMPNYTAGKATPWALENDAYRTTITNAIFEKGVVRIGDRALEEHTALTTVTMANTVTTMGTYVMNASGRVASVKLSDNLTSLPTGTFNNNSGLKALTIPYGTSVNSQTFRKVGSELVLTIYEGSKAYTWATGEGSSEGKTPNVTDREYGLSYVVMPLGGSVTDDGSVTWSLKDGVLTVSGEGEIPNYTATADQPWANFRAGVTSVVVENGITRIGDRAFQEFTDLVSVQMADSVSAMGTYIFNACGKLENVKLSANIAKLENGVFNNAKSLKELTIPSKTEIITSAFAKTPSDIVIYVYAGSKAHSFFGETLTISDVLEIGSTDDNKTYGERTCTVLDTESGTDGTTTWSWDYATKTVTIGGTGAMSSWHTDAEKKTDSGWYMNRGWHGYQSIIEKVVIGNGITRIGDYAFMQCTKLAEVEFEATSSLKTIGGYAFSNTILTEVDIPESVTLIEHYAFRAASVDNVDTHTLEKVVINGKATSLQDTALARQSKVVVYCYYDSPAAKYAHNNGVEYRLVDMDYHIDNYSRGDRMAKVLNSTDADKAANVVFANYASGELTSLSIVPVTLTTGFNEVPVGEDFVQTTAGKVYVFLWDAMNSLKPLAKSYMPDARVWMLGDSIMADWGDGRYPQEGWGEAFKDVVTSKATVYNRAISGYTAESCYNKIWTTNEANNDAGANRDWTPVRDEVSEGDYVMIAYLHNDYCAVADPGKNNGLYQSTEYINTYKDYLSKIVDETLERGAEIILVVPPNKGVTYNFHNQPVAGVDVGDYSAVMPALAEEKGVPCVSIHKWTMEETAKDASFLDTIYLTKTYLNGLVASGEVTEEQLNNHSNSGIKNNRSDTTHLSVLGCKNVAEFVASSIKEQKLSLAAYLK